MDPLDEERVGLCEDGFWRDRRSFLLTCLLGSISLAGWSAYTCSNCSLAYTFCFHLMARECVSSFLAVARY